MVAEINEMLDRLRFELKFIEDGGYGRSPHRPQRPPLVFEDSPTCLNFNDAARPCPCGDCFLMQFVPKGRQEERIPCRFIPITEKGLSVDDLYRNGTQVEIEEALKNWLKKEIRQMEQQRPSSGRRETTGLDQGQA